MKNPLYFINKYGLSVLLTIISLFLYTQTKESTAEAEYLKKKKQITFYRIRAYGGDRNTKISVLDDILTNIDKYSFRDKDLVDLVVLLSQEGVTHKEFKNNQLINYYPEVRMKACIILGKLGGKEAKYALVEAINKDDEYMVKAEAALALAELGDQDDNLGIHSIVFSFRTMDPMQPNPNFTIAVIDALEKLLKSSDTKDAFSSDAVLVLADIVQGNYTREVRDRAYKVLTSLR